MLSRSDLKFKDLRVTTEEQKTFKQSAIKTWNALFASIKEITTATQFNESLKSFLTKERNKPFSFLK